MITRIDLREWCCTLPTRWQLTQVGGGVVTTLFLLLCGCSASLHRSAYHAHLRKETIKTNNGIQWNPAYRGRSLEICFFRFKNNPAYLGAIHLSGHSTEDFFHLSNMLYTFEKLIILCNGRKALPTPARDSF